MLQALGDDPKGERLHPGKRGLLGVAVRQDPGDFNDLGQPAAVVLPFEFNLECDQGNMPFASAVYAMSTGALLRGNRPAAYAGPVNPVVRPQPRCLIKPGT